MMRFPQEMFGGWFIRSIDTECNTFGAISGINMGDMLYTITLEGDGNCIGCGEEGEFLCKECQKVLHKQGEVRKKLKKL